LVDALPVLVEDPAIVGVHEGVAAALELIVDARAALEIVAARAATTNETGFEPFLFQSFDRFLNLSDLAVELTLSGLVSLEVLDCALIGLDAGEFEAGCGVDGLGDRHYLRGRVNAAAARAAVDLHQAFDCRAVLLGGCRELADIRQIVDAYDDACAVAR